ncbi:hypothetical protein C8F04DRAFT_1149198 [Mycena alexandri]|uniref:G domain-containing protein n=1 Tax=Mycena alexandri TaxID=1745969 RepID=A0AAD6S4U0_9AGAR|nr:hypothetical protein C8F04DRAFT_1149198 [Mycena alexandri]
MSSSTEISPKDDLSFWNIRGLAFRILILGRANAGKTTILERLTGDAMEKAKICRDGEVLQDQIVRGQSDRGLHNVEDEIYFSSKPGFVFHDSRGVEAGSTEELSIVQQFVEHHTSTHKLKEQLHAIWMCLPLDESRELFEGEKAFLHWKKGGAVSVVIFTKHDGAVQKETTRIIDKILEGSQEHTVTRAIRKDARQRAEVEVTNRVNFLEQQLRGLSIPNSSIAFLTTGGMEERTLKTDQACQQLMDLTEHSLTGPTLKTLLAVVWGRNLSRCRYWGLYWVLMENHGKTKLGSGMPSTHALIQKVVEIVMVTANWIILCCQLIFLPPTCPLLLASVVSSRCECYIVRCLHLSALNSCCLPL